MTVDRIVERDGRDAPCRTHEIPLGHGRRRARPAAGRGRPATTPTRGSPTATATRRTRCSASPASAASCAQPILPGHPDLLAEAVYAARREQAQSVGDVLLRRTRLGAARRARACWTSPDAVLRVAAGGRRRGGLGRRSACGAEADAFRAEAAAEGLARLMSTALAGAGRGGARRAVGAPSAARSSGASASEADYADIAAELDVRREQVADLLVARPPGGRPRSSTATPPPPRVTPQCAPARRVAGGPAGRRAGHRARPRPRRRARRRLRAVPGRPARAPARRASPAARWATATRHAAAGARAGAPAARAPDADPRRRLAAGGRRGRSRCCSRWRSPFGGGDDASPPPRPPRPRSARAPSTPRAATRSRRPASSSARRRARTAK